MGTFGANVRDLRDSNGWTREDLAGRLGITPQAVYYWESGRSRPRYETLQRISSMFGITVDALLGDERLVPSPSSVMVPVLGTAHMGGFESIEDADYHVEVPASVMERHPRAFIVHGFGPCMNRRFPEDAHLLVDPDMLPRNGDAVLAQSDQGAVVRTWMRGSSTLMLSPDSWSEDLPDIIGTPDGPPVSLVGVVVWYQAADDVRP